MDSWRPLTPDDLPRAGALSACCGWNQTSADWGFFLAHGHVLALDDGHPDLLAATAAVLPHGAELAWISMVLVRPDRRRQGLATRLLRWALDRLGETRRIALDATPEGRAVYRRLGFSDVWGFSRWSLPPVLEMDPATPTHPARDVEMALTLDARAIAAPRGALLRSFAERLPAAARVADGGAILGRDGRRAAQLGPVLAQDAATARALLADARHALGPDTPCIADLRDDATAVTDWIAGQGGRRLRPFTRMARGAAWLAQDALCFAVAGPEFG
jgi:GNAT superfamily N-acetyltransferase